MKLQGHEALGYKRPAGGAEHLNDPQGSKNDLHTHGKTINSQVLLRTPPHECIESPLPRRNVRSTVNPPRCRVANRNGVF